MHVALIGIGLMGGSIAKALRAKEADVRITGYARREETRRAGLVQGVLDEAYDDPAAAVVGADLVVICTPVKRIPEMVRAIAPSLGVDAVVTDVGSTKGWLEEEISDERFVGSHPMCGSEKTGLDAARADLYEDAVCVVTSPSERGRQVTAFWQLLGCKVLVMSASVHDQLAAQTSHVPHLSASALVLALAGEGSASEFAGLCGTGFRDTTRVASGDARMWRDIVESNPDSIMEGLRAVAGCLEELADLVEQGEFDALEDRLAQAAARRDAIIEHCCTKEKTDV